MADDTHSRFAAVSEDDMQFQASGWPYDKTDEARSCDIFNLGSSYFHVPLTTVRHLLNVTLITVHRLYSVEVLLNCYAVAAPQT